MATNMVTTILAAIVLYFFGASVVKWLLNRRIKDESEDPIEEDINAISQKLTF